MYGASIALNNIGVSLLEHRAYGQAIHTFKDAIHVMKLLLRTEPHDQLYSTASTANSLQEKLDRASQRIAHPCRMQVVKSLEDHLVCLDDSSVYSMWKECSLIFPEMVDTAATDPRTTTESSQSSCKALSFLMIRLDGSTLHEDAIGCDLHRDRNVLDEARLSHDLGMESAMILYNLGLSYFCLARYFTKKSSFMEKQPDLHSARSKQQDPESLTQQAMKLFYMSYSTLTNRARKSGADLTQSLRDGRLSFSAVLLNSIVRTELALDNRRMALHRYQKLISVMICLHRYANHSTADTAMQWMRAAAAA